VGVDELSWDDVRVFLAVFETRTLKAAAARLGVNATTVGRRLDALEAALDARLFLRSRAGIEPTAAAEQLVPAALEVARAAAGFAQRSRGLSRSPEGEVTLSAPTGIANLLLVPLLPGLLARHPELRVHVDTNDAYADLDALEADLALRGSSVRGALPGGDLVARQLGAAPSVPLATPEYARTLGTVDDLSAVRWVTFGPRMDGNPWARKVVGQVPESSIVVRSDDPNTVFAAARAGLGATWMTRPFASLVGLVEIPLAPKLAHLVEGADQLWLVGHRNLRDVPRVAAVWDYLVEAIAGHFG